MFEFKLPDLGEGIAEGEILKWFVTPGEPIEEDAPLVEVETDKAAVTIPSPVGGQVVSLGGAVGDVVMVGTVIVVIDDGSTESAAVGAKQKPIPPPMPAIKQPESPRGAGPVPAAPATRRLARELGVELNLVSPSGPAGRVTAADVQAHARGVQAQGTPPPDLKEVPREVPRPMAETAQAAQAAATIPFLDLEPLPDFSQWGEIERAPLRSIRRKVAHKMVTSMTLVPHVAHMDDADVTLIEEFRLKERQRRVGQPGEHLTLLAFVIKAVTAGLRATPAFNSSLDPFSEEVITKRYYNIGIAADTGRGLVVPVIKHTDTKSIIQISTDLREVVGRAREGKLEMEEMRGGTFTITNVGPLGGTALIPAINYPEVAILGMGKVQEKPVVREGQIVIRKILPLTLAFDHRIADGADAARFVSEMVRQLSDPNRLLLET